MLLAAIAFDHDRGSHGQLLSEATSAEADPNGTGRTRFLAHGPFTDWAEKARIDAIDAYRKQGTKDEPVNMNGLWWSVEKKTYGT